ncbi:MarR family transcriptional regulator [Devosia sp. PTR5]|uniref:MarR family transcriptional regulator n=1 Tax=Devosia oryzisoli TaxID=2774138 RepID=A0A927FWB3_9HYPH|nr:MarR family transcriptional regulator [Devosia oryzisoli]MBD8066329.1 MarR family transcriptional regulator [Devosia oryzisoli]
MRAHPIALDAMQDTSTSQVTVGHLVNDVARLFRRRFEEQARAHGLTLTQWKVIAHLYRQPQITQVALAGHVDSDPMTMSGVLDRLEKRGLIEREPNPTDSRAKLARLSPAGTQLYSTAKAVGTQMHASALAGLDERRRQALVASLETIRNNLNDMPAQPNVKDV